MSVTTALHLVTDDGFAVVAHSLSELLLHSSNQSGKKLWIKDTEVYIRTELDAQEIRRACVLSMLLISDAHQSEEYLAIIDRNLHHQRHVAAAVARIFSLFDAVYEKIMLFASTPYSACIVSCLSAKEIHQMLLSNSSREHCFHRCSFTSEQSAALLDHDLPVNLNLNHCTIDASVMAEVLTRKKTKHSLGKLTLAGNVSREDRSMESFWTALNKSHDEPVFDEVTLKGYVFLPTDMNHLAGANTRCLALTGDCVFDDAACNLLVDAIETGSLKATSLKLYDSNLQQHPDERENRWSRRVLQAIGSRNCTLEELFLGSYESDDHVDMECALLLEILKSNAHLRHIHLSTTPLHCHEECWSTFLDTLSCHRSLKQITLRPPSEAVPAGWNNELEQRLFAVNQTIHIAVKAQSASDNVEMANLWQETCVAARLGGTCRIADHGIRSFILTSVLEQQSDSHGLVFSLLQRNLDLFAYEGGTPTSNYGFLFELS
ncbi:hypothetical protein FisN_19Hh319 [Fistulifera solaris]|uniref:Uncharacterized protein n=1 Tax=Fistulifera solaris TaxID=1519565 RepID=A0A1Z5K155_FISSO|nr:hypothetical protein FisN_19Hh319 [Fistulifera solaris]|eukprot:GAX19731.1 hypothetical protein FisN_19Hh319 [Fistulifera solaris]